MAVLAIPILVLVAVVIAIIVYAQTKSWKKTGYFFEILIALAVFVLGANLSRQTITEQYLMIAIILLGAGLFINGIVSLLKK